MSTFHRIARIAGENLIVTASIILYALVAILMLIFTVINFVNDRSGQGFGTLVLTGVMVAATVAGVGVFRREYRFALGLGR